MAVSENITRIKTNIANTYSILEAKGATMPEIKNSDNLASCADSVEIGGSNNELLPFIDRSITSIESDTEVVGSHAFSYCQSLNEVIMPKAKVLNMNCFQNCTALVSVSLPEVQKIGNNAFRYCPITSVHFPKVTAVGTGAFQNCSSLTKARFDKAITIDNSAFGSCGNFIALVLTNTSGISTLSNTNAFSGTPIASGTGYIYMPRALIDDFKSATNWSTFADQFRAIEDYPQI